MKRHISFVHLFLLTALACGVLTAQDEPPVNEPQQTEQAVEAIAAFPAETQNSILELCQKPELITEMAKTKKLPDLQGCSEAIQKAAELLERYPDIIETLACNIETAKSVGRFYAESPDKALELVKKGAANVQKEGEITPEEAVEGIAAFPSQIQTAVLEICQKPELIAEMAKTKTLPDLQGCSEAIQKAAKQLLEYPEIIDMLNQNTETAKKVGEFYAQSPDKALELLKKGAAEGGKEGQGSVEEAVQGIAAFPPETQTAVLEICQKPELITAMAQTKKLPDLQGYSEAIQKAAQGLIQHPDIIETLNENLDTAKKVGEFYAQSPDKALALLKEGAGAAEQEKQANIEEAIEGIASYPPETRTAILEICQKPELITEMAKTKKLPDIQAYSEAIQKAAQELIQYPDIIQTLDENIEAAKMVGSFYAQSPAQALELVSKAAEGTEQENQNSKEKWMKMLQDDPKALAEYRKALEDMKKKQAAKGEAAAAATTTDVPAPDTSLQADTTDDSVTVYSAPSPELVDYIVVNADDYPDLAVQVSLFWGGWPYWHHYRPWHHWRPWPYWPGPVVYHHGGPWYHPWHNPWGPWYHPWHRPLEPLHPAWHPGPHPWPHPSPDHHPHWPVAPLKPVGPAPAALSKPGGRVPTAFHNLHGLASPQELAKNPQTLGEWAKLKRESPESLKPLVEDKDQIQKIMSRRDEFPNLANHVDAFGERHPEHELNEWKGDIHPAEQPRVPRVEPRDFGERPISLHSGEYSTHQRISAANYEHRASWGGMSHSGRSFGGGGFHRR